MFAIISDIHSNIEALTAVLADIETRGVDKIVCLGDIVGYGPDPCECVDLVIERCEFAICGNHDHAVFYEPYNFNVGAERACYWTRQILEDEPRKTLRDRRWEFLGKLPVRAVYEDMLFVHGSPRRPVNEYLFADDVYSNPHKLMANFERLQNIACFIGHTHVPGVFVDDPYFESPEELAEPGVYELAEDDKVIINIGSVGQPRDRDPRAAYGLVDDDGRVEFLRVEYDIEKVVHKILNTPELDDFLGHRLLEGR
ncbi:MAG TPA: metallophosphoesterase family protein [Phycisphaerae bacterium]|nr:metallophosphoesterase family protein [Phycisphaerae bacterium]HRY69428.1 metallophosphoesterase family protein [Phycisphaerae bacterium]HSA26295.1 metallophosphoesterase family protein [Phycisphaerae bacterium]